MIDYTALAAASMSLIGTLVGTFGGILVANKLTNYRIEQLELKVAEHNKLVDCGILRRLRQSEQPVGPSHPV